MFDASTQSRREFLQRLAAVTAALAVDPLEGISAVDGVYRNARLGLAAGLPDGWIFSSVADFAALRERTVLQDALDNGAHPLKDPDNLPVLLCEDVRHGRREFAPGIVLFDETLDRMPADEVAGHRWMLASLGRSYRDLRVVEAPRPVALHGAPATLSRLSYLHELDTGESHRLDVRTLLVFRPPRVHTYYLVDSAEAPCVDPRVWDEFIASIEYAHPLIDV